MIMKFVLIKYERVRRIRKMRRENKKGKKEKKKEFVSKRNENPIDLGFEEGNCNTATLGFGVSMFHEE